MKISNFKSKNVSVIGQGYVGLPLSMAAGKAGHKVFGVDIDVTKVETLKSGKSTIEDIADLEIKNLFLSGNFVPTSDFNVVSESDIIIICVPTPLDSVGMPDLEILKNAIENISEFLMPGSTIIIESTVAPGTTRQIISPLIEKRSGLSTVEFGLAFSPERIDPGNRNWTLSNTPKLISAIDDKTLLLVQDFYGTFIDEIFICPSTEVAECAKLLENSFRLINISFINEIMLFCDAMGVNTLEVIEAAKTKPYGFMSFYPSIGIGGHCIPIDPVYLSEAAKSIGAPIKSIELATNINNSMPKLFAKKIYEHFKGDPNKTIMVIGMAYKPNVSDIRETPSAKLVQELRDFGFNVCWHDELVGEWNNEKSTPLNVSFDLGVVAVLHSNVNLDILKNKPIMRIGVNH